MPRQAIFDRIHPEDRERYLVDDLLDVSRVSRGKLELRVETLMLSPVLAHAVEGSHEANSDGPGKGSAFTVPLPLLRG